MGSIRAAMFSKYLPDFGWEPFVLTAFRISASPTPIPQLDIDGLPPDDHVVRVTYTDNDMKTTIRQRTFRERLRHFVCIEEANPPGLADRMAAAKLPPGFRFDVVWATSPGQVPLRIARDVARARGTPWVADLRDIEEQEWGGDQSLRSRLFRVRSRSRRTRLLRTAAEIVTVSRHHAQTLERTCGRPVHVIPNGFDEAAFPEDATPSPKRFNIAYAGRILSEHLRNPKPLFAALDSLVSTNAICPDDVRVDFVGTEPGILEQLLDGYQCGTMVRAVPAVSHAEVPAILQSSQILLVLTNHGRKGILTTKLFEYLGARRPILCVPDEGGELTTLLQQTNAGTAASDPVAIADQIKRWYDEWKAADIVSFHGRESEIMKYSRRSQTGNLAKVLEDACNTSTLHSVDG
ncbi:glycosyltransferase [Planctomycetota bacterium]